jgi:AcrR family transcriptional regulator
VSARREEIIEVAKEIFAERGVRQTTVRQIGAGAGILSGSLYHHFASKYDIVDAILSEFCQESLAGYRALQESDTDIIERLHRMIHFALSQSVSNGAAIAILLNDSRQLVDDPRFAYLIDYNEVIASQWISLLRQGIDTRRIRPDADPALTYRFARDVILGVNRWYDPKRGRTLDEIADAFFGVLVHGITVPAGPIAPRSKRRRSV